MIMMSVITRTYYKVPPPAKNGKENLRVFISLVSYAGKNRNYITVSQRKARKTHKKHYHIKEV